MTDRECIAQLQAVRLFCSPEQVMAVDRAVGLLLRQIKEHEKTPLP